VDVDVLVEGVLLLVEVLVLDVVSESD